MRQIEQKMCQAIHNHREWSLDNTSVTLGPHTTRVILHGNLIAAISGMNIALWSRGYRTATTKSRLNAILRHFNAGCVYQKNHVWYYQDGNDTIPFEDGMVVEARDDGH